MSVDDLPPIGYAARAGAVRERLAAAGVDGMCVTDAVSVRWLTGFSGSNGTVALTADRLVLVTDNRYRDRAADPLQRGGVTHGRIVVGRVEPTPAANLAPALHPFRGRYCNGSARWGLCTPAGPAKRPACTARRHHPRPDRGR